MSFILDALKKSEERRQKEELTAPRKRVLVMGGAGPRRWPLWLVVALLPTALLVGWWLGQTPRSTAPPETIPEQRVEQSASAPRQIQTIPDNAVAQAALPTAAAPPVRALPTNQKPLPEPDIVATDTASKAPEPEVTTAAPLQAPVPVQKSQPKTSSRTASPSSPVETTTVRPEPASPPAYIELPRELRDRMPVLKITLHFFSADPVRRLVRINGRLLHEGETVADGLTIHEIAETKTVLDYQGLLFEVPSPGG